VSLAKSKRTLPLRKQWMDQRTGLSMLWMKRWIRIHDFTLNRTQSTRVVTYLDVVQGTRRTIRCNRRRESNGDTL
jgi:hypothetical protein